MAKEKSTDLKQITEKQIKSAEKTGEKTIGALFNVSKILSDGFGDIRELKTGFRSATDQKKSRDEKYEKDNKQFKSKILKEAKASGKNFGESMAIMKSEYANKLRKDEIERERAASFEGKLEELGDKIVGGLKDIGKVSAPAGMGKILFGIVGLLAGVVTGFVAEVASLFSFLRKPFMWTFGPKSMIYNTLSKIGKLFSKQGLIGKLLMKMQPIFTFFGNILNKIKAVGMFFGRILTAFSPTLTGLSTAGTKFKAFLKPLIATFKSMFKMGKVFGSVLGKLFLPITIISSIVSGLIASWSKFAEGDIIGGIGAFFGGILDFITFGIIDVEKFTDWFTSLFSNFFGIFENLFSGNIVGAITSLGNYLLDFFIGLPELVFDGILNAIAGIFNFFGLDSIGGWFSDFADVDILGTIKDFFAKMMEYISPAIDFIMDGMVAVFGGIGTAFSWIYDNVFVPYISTLSTILMAVFGGIGDALTLVYDTIISPVIDGISKFFGMLGWAFSNFGFLLQTALNGAVGMINNILDYVPGMGPDTLEPYAFAEAPEGLPGLALGGMVEGLQDGMGKLFRLGEGGDEMVTPLDQLQSRIIDPVITKAMSMTGQLAPNSHGVASGNANTVIVNAPNNSNTSVSSTSTNTPMSYRNNESSRRIDLNW